MTINKDNSSIPMFKTHKSMEKKQIRVTNQNRGKRIRYEENDNTTFKCNTNRNELSIIQNSMKITNITQLNPK